MTTKVKVGSAFGDCNGEEAEVFFIYHSQGKDTTEPQASEFCAEEGNYTVASIRSERELQNLVQAFDALGLFNASTLFSYWVSMFEISPREKEDENATFHFGYDVISEFFPSNQSIIEAEAFLHSEKATLPWSALNEQPNEVNSDCVTFGTALGQNAGFNSSLKDELLRLFDTKCSEPIQGIICRQQCSASVVNPTDPDGTEHPDGLWMNGFFAILSGVLFAVVLTLFVVLTKREQSFKKLKKEKEREQSFKKLENEKEREFNFPVQSII